MKKRVILLTGIALAFAACSHQTSNEAASNDAALAGDNSLADNSADIADNSLDASGNASNSL